MTTATPTEKESSMNQFETGSRWEDSDPRSGDRVVKIVDNTAGSVMSNRFGKLQVEVMTSQYNPVTVGRKYWIKPSSLTRRYRKISR